MHEKTTGYLLLALGILVIIISAIVIFLIFTGRMEPVGVFSINAPTINTNDLLPQAAARISEGKEIELIPTETFNKTLNMVVQFFLMSFMLNVGYKISSLGVQMLRQVKVEVKQ